MPASKSSSSRKPPASLRPHRIAATPGRVAAVVPPPPAAKLAPSPGQPAPPPSAGPAFSPAAGSSTVRRARLSAVPPLRSTWRAAACRNPPSPSSRLSKFPSGSVGQSSRSAGTRIRAGCPSVPTSCDPSAARGSPRPWPAPSRRWRRQRRIGAQPRAARRVKHLAPRMRIRVTDGKIVRVRIPRAPAKARDHAGRQSPLREPATQMRPQTARSGRPRANSSSAPAGRPPPSGTVGIERIRMPAGAATPSHAAANSATGRLGSTGDFPAPAPQHGLVRPAQFQPSACAACWRCAVGQPCVLSRNRSANVGIRQRVGHVHAFDAVGRHRRRLVAQREHPQFRRLPMKFCVSRKSSWPKFPRQRQIAADAGLEVKRPVNRFAALPPARRAAHRQSGGIPCRTPPWRRNSGESRKPPFLYSSSTSIRQYGAAGICARSVTSTLKARLLSCWISVRSPNLMLSLRARARLHRREPAPRGRGCSRAGSA